MYAQERAKQIVQQLHQDRTVRVTRSEVAAHRDLAARLREEIETYARDYGVRVYAKSSMIDQSYTYSLEDNEHK